MNDDFLHRLREPPPAAFAARLRARLEAQALTRSFRRRQLTLYSLIACLLGSTAVALVVPAVRETTSAAIRGWLPQSMEPSLPTEQPRALLRYLDHTAREQFRIAMQDSPRASASVAPTPFVSTRSVTRESSAALAPATYVAGSSALGSPELHYVRLAGAAATHAALQTVFAEAEQQHNIRVLYGPTGNASAISMLCREDTDIALATRMIEPDEIAACRRFGDEVSVLPVAIEALAVLTNPSNGWAVGLDREALKLLFDPALVLGTATWNQLDPEWPALPVDVLAPRAGSSLSEAFNDLVFGNNDRQRQRAAGTDFTNDTARLLQRLQRSVNGVTYVPYPSYVATQKMVGMPIPKALGIFNANGVSVLPTRDAIADGSYDLARPLLMIIKRRARRDADTDTFARLALSTAEQRLARSVYLPLTPAETKLALRILHTMALPALSTEDIEPVTAAEILLRQLPEEKREAARASLLESAKKPVKE